MIIEIAFGILLAYILIVTIRFWLPFLVWIVLGLIGLIGFLIISS